MRCSLPCPAVRGQVCAMSEGAELGNPRVVCMPERLGLCTYPEGPEQSLSGEKEGIRGDVL